MSKRMTETQIVSILKEAEAGIPAKELCRKYGITSSTFYKWRSKYVNTPFLTQHHRRIIKPPACTQQVSYH